MSSRRPRIGRYELVARLATGGSAEIYVARQVGLAGVERPAIVKRLLPHLADDPAHVEQLVNEARLVAGLSHPNVVLVHELGVHKGLPFLALEWVPGSTLRQLLSAAQSTDPPRPVPVGVAAGIVLQALEGLHAAHELRDATGRSLGLVHRDVSPQNLMVTDDGWLKLLDFGIAKATRRTDVTIEGGLKGTLRYVSPEQARQEPLDRRSDLFSLAATAWELLAGEPLFLRHTELETLSAIDRAEWRGLRERRGDVPGGVEAVLKRALSGDRKQRFSTADEMRRALAEAAESSGLDVSRDAIGPFVQGLRGRAHAEAKAAVEAALRRPAEDLFELDDDAPAPDRLDRTIARRRRRSLLARTSAAVTLLVLLTVGGYAWWSRRPPPTSGPTIEVGWAPITDPAVRLRELEPLRVWMERQTGRPIVFMVADSYDALADRLVDGSLPFAVLPPYLFLRASARTPSVRPLAVESFDGSSGNDGVLVVPERSQVNGVSELKGRRICYTDRRSATGWLLPRATLRAAGVDPDRDIAGEHFSGTHLQLLRDLDAGRCDAGGIYSGAYLSADRAGVKVAQLRVLAVTGHAPHDVASSGPGASEKDSQLIAKTLLSFDAQSALGVATVGQIERLSGFRKPDAAQFDRLRRVLEAESGASP